MCPSRSRHRSDSSTSSLGGCQVSMGLWDTSRHPAATGNEASTNPGRAQRGEEHRGLVSLGTTTMLGPTPVEYRITKFLIV